MMFVISIIKFYINENLSLVITQPIKYKPSLEKTYRFLFFDHFFLIYRDKKLEHYRIWISSWKTIALLQYLIKLLLKLTIGLSLPISWTNCWTNFWHQCMEHGFESWCQFPQHLTYKFFVCPLFQQLFLHTCN